MLIPLNTDAPIYHFPWATLGLIGANIACFFLTGWGDLESRELWDAWMLHYGQGLRPLEWISCHFLHFGVLHLVGNMIFLWGFGLVVEGKLGWWRYLPLYFGIGVAVAFIEQVMMLNHDLSDPFAVEGSGGASGVVYGILTMALLWAPKNEVTCILFILYRGAIFDMTILSFAGFYIAVQVLFAWIGGFEMSSAMIHLLGAVVGFGVGTVLLELKWVNCENWDLFAVLKGTHGSREVFENDQWDLQRWRTRTVERDRDQDSRDEGQRPVGGRKRKANDDGTGSVARMRKLLREAKPKVALAELRRIEHHHPKFQVARRDLEKLIYGLSQWRFWADAIPLMEEYIERFPDRSARVRLMLGKILIKEQNQPREALRVLQEIPDGALPEELEGRRKKLVRAARRMMG